MISFSVPHRDTSSGFFTFTVSEGAVLFAGSRHLSVDRSTCLTLVNGLGRFGFSLMTGCADGVDSSFRNAFSESDFKDSSLVACAFKSRVKKFKGTSFPLFVVPDNLHPKVALAKRTLWMTSRCSFLILFPSDPMGKGSSLAFKSAIMNSKPVFVVQDTRPKESCLYSVYPSSLYGVVKGFWCIPPVYQDTGLCIEAV